MTSVRSSRRTSRLSRRGTASRTTAQSSTARLTHGCGRSGTHCPALSDLRLQSSLAKRNTAKYRKGGGNRFPGSEMTVPYDGGGKVLGDEVVIKRGKGKKGGEKNDNVN